jgi:5-methylcytosine-specific restriction endonuclease McrA
MDNAREGRLLEREVNRAFDNNAISFAERALNLLDQGSFTSTYKYAVLLAMMDVVLERTSKTGTPPSVITTRQLAEKVIEIYWPHTNQFPLNKKTGELLKQNTKGQAEIIRVIQHFRSNKTVGESAPLFAAKHADAKGYKKLVDKVEWKLIELPLPRLQRIGKTRREFIYTLHWEESITQGIVSSYQRGEASLFDNRIMLCENVGEYFVRLNSLLRPLIQKEWSHFVAQVNMLEEARLQRFLFDTTRAGAAALCNPLSELQNHYCFYCHEKIGNNENTKPEVDHFIPWARYPNDSLTNYVVAHSKCNRDKRDHLAAISHKENWLNRLEGQLSVLEELTLIANDNSWELGEEKSKSITHAIYKHLQPEVELWKIGKEFEVVDKR